MKLTNQQTAIPFPNRNDENDKDYKATFADLLRIVAESPRINPRTGEPEGTTVAQMRTRIQVIDICEGQPEVLEFNASQTVAIKELVAAYKWGAVHKDLVAFWDAIEAADAPKEVKESDG